MDKGWASLEADKTPKKQAITDEERLIADIFSSKKGEKALEVLANMTVGKPILQQLAGDGVNTSIFMALREGENSLYRRIVAIKKRVNNE